MTKRLEPDFRLGLTGAIVSYLSWGLMPIYWNLLEGAGSVEVIAHRILWSLLFIPLVMAVRGKLRSAWSDIKSILTSPVTALLLATAACFAGLNWWINVIVLSGVQFNAISVMNSSSLMTRGERSILNFDPRCFCSLMPPRCAFCVPECL